MSNAATTNQFNAKTSTVDAATGLAGNTLGLVASAFGLDGKGAGGKNMEKDASSIDTGKIQQIPQTKQQPDLTLQPQQSFVANGEPNTNTNNQGQTIQTQSTPSNMNWTSGLGGW